MDIAASLLTFEEWALDLRNRRLLRRGEPVALGSRYFDALALLLREPGALVTKESFMAEVWAGIPVTDEALTQCIRTLRRALGDDSAAPRFIATVPKHGYRFVAPVTRAGVPAPEIAPSPAAAGAIAGWSAAGGLAAGALGGAAYGALAATHGAMAILAILGAALGFLGGAGTGLGLAAARALWPRHGWAQVIGGAAGGLMIGALGAMLGRDGVALIAGARIGPVTGLGEGMALGAAFGLGQWLGEGRSRRAALALAAVIGLAAGGVVTLAGGRLFGGSLLAMEQGLATSRLGLRAALEPWGGWLAPVEGAVFLLGVTAALMTRAARAQGRRG